jgi:hypothetical protein
MVLIIWGFTALVVGIPYSFHRKERYYGEVGYWCFIRKGFTKEQLISSYLWLWMAAFLMVILYLIMFIVMRGWFIVDNGIYWYKNYRRRHDVKPVEETQDEKDSKAVANLMLYYPILSIICILPTSSARWLYFTTDREVSYKFTLVSSTLFSCCGIFDAILFFLTRPDLVAGTADVESLPLASAPAAKSQESSRRAEITSTHSPTASDYIFLDVEGDYTSQFQPYNGRLRPEDADSRRGMSRGRNRSDLDSDAIEMSRERSNGDFRSMPSPAPVEESEYGSLPNR